MAERDIDSTVVSEHMLAHGPALDAIVLPLAMSAVRYIVGSGSTGETFADRRGCARSHPGLING